MIVSMTGYGEAQRCQAGISYALELRSLNNRYFKSSIKLPDGLQFAEPEIETLLRTRLTRGSVLLTLRMRDESATAAFNINRDALASYAGALKGVELPEGVHATIDLATLSTLPGVCQMPDADGTQREAQTAIVRNLVADALDELMEMRRREGQALHDDLLQHCDQVKSRLAVIDERAPLVMEEYQQRLASRVKQLLGDGSIELDKDSISREVALYAERCDISEELVRLRAHLDHFLEVCEATSAVGRKLDFIAQEMLREANTIGSKSNDAQIARSVVELKATIDRIKEQVQNAE